MSIILLKRTTAHCFHSIWNKHESEQSNQIFLNKTQWNRYNKAFCGGFTIHNSLPEQALANLQYAITMVQLIQKAVTVEWTLQILV
jgi:hypothetical protein